MNNVDKFKQAHKEFVEVQEEFIDMGARDTEPDGVYQFAVVTAFTGGKPFVPQNSFDWQLYDNDGADNASQNMTEATDKVLEAMGAVTMTERPELKKFLEGNFSRADYLLEG